MDPKISQMECRCPRLGSIVRFGYCLNAGENALPCFKTCDCWWEVFDVVAYLKCRLSEEDFETLTGSRPKPKITGLLQLIEQARERCRTDN